MDNAHHFKTVLSHQNVVGVLVFLHDIGGESKTTIIWKEGLGGNYASVRRSVEKLRDAGLVTMSPVERRSNHILIRLTPLGWEVSELLARANVLVVSGEMDLSPEECDPDDHSDADRNR